MNRRKFLTASSSSILIGAGGCLDDTAPTNSTEGDGTDQSGDGNGDDNRGGNGADRNHTGRDDDEEREPQLQSIGWLLHESMHGQQGELKQISATGSASTDPIESSGELHVLLIDRPIELESTESTLTVDLLHTDSDESERQLLHLGRGEWNNGFTCFLPPADGYQLDVQAEDDVYWELTVVDPSVFRTESSYETVSFNKHNEIRAIGGGNNVFGAVRLSPGMRVKLANNDSAFPLSAKAYTETGQREVLFDETVDDGQIVETNLDGVTWFDVTHVVEDFLDDWELKILPES